MKYAAKLVYAPMPVLDLPPMELPGDWALQKCYTLITYRARIHYELDHVKLHDDVNVAVYYGHEILEGEDPHGDEDDGGWKPEPVHA